MDNRSKRSRKKQGGGDGGSGLEKVKSRLLKTCKGLLQRLKRKNVWAFNVHAHFGIVKCRLNKNFVKS